MNRTLLLEGTDDCTSLPDGRRPGVPVESIINASRRLETDKAYRDAFFKEPVLLPGAQAYVHSWCHNATQILFDALHAHPVLKQVLPSHAAPFSTQP